MKNQRFLLLVSSVLIGSLLVLGSCKSGKGGRKQPRKGPMPCPLKDC